MSSKRHDVVDELVNTFMTPLYHAKKLGKWWQRIGWLLMVLKRMPCDGSQNDGPIKKVKKTRINMKEKPDGGNCVICKQQEKQNKYTKNGSFMKGYILVNEKRDIWKVVREEWVSFCSIDEHVSKNKNHISCDKQMHAVGYLDDNDIQLGF